MSSSLPEVQRTDNAIIKTVFARESGAGLRLTLIENTITPQLVTIRFNSITLDSIECIHSLFVTKQKSSCTGLLSRYHLYLSFSFSLLNVRI